MIILCPVTQALQKELVQPELQRKSITHASSLHRKSAASAISSARPREFHGCFAAKCEAASESSRSGAVIGLLTKPGHKALIWKYVSWFPKVRRLVTLHVYGPERSRSPSAWSFLQRHVSRVSNRACSDGRRCQASRLR